jgi:hypothetical protein
VVFGHLLQLFFVGVEVSFRATATSGNELEYSIVPMRQISCIVATQQFAGLESRPDRP